MTKTWANSDWKRRMKIRTHCNFCQKKSLGYKYSFEDYSILECKFCGFVLRDRILSFKEEEELYQKDYYLNIQKEYFINCLTPHPKDKSRMKDFSKRLELLEKITPDKKQKKLIDIGAGTGAFGYLADQRGWKSLNLEISPFAAEIAKKKFKVSVYKGNFSNNKFLEHGFEVATLWESVANIEDTHRLFKKINKVLNKNGKIAILTTVIDSWLYDLAKLIYIMTFGKVHYFVREGFPIHHSNHFTRKHLKKFLENSGFRIIYQSNEEIPYKYTKLPKYYLPLLLLVGQIAKFFGRSIQFLVIAQKI